jgi:hypothetical protein
MDWDQEIDTQEINYWQNHCPCCDNSPCTCADETHESCMLETTEAA